MPVVKMQKVALLSHKSAQEDLLEFLHDEGVMEISPNEETEDIEHPKVSYEKAEVIFAMNYLRDFAEKETIKDAKRLGSLEEIRKGATHTDFREIIDECKTLEDAESEVQSERQKLVTEEAKLKPWESLSFKLNERETESTVVLTGSGSGLGSEFEKYISNELPRTTIVSAGDLGGQFHIAVIVWKEDLEKFEQLAASHGWTEIQLPKADRTPDQELKRIKQVYADLDKKEEEILNKKKELAKNLPDLSRLALYLQWIDQKQSVRSEFSQTQQTVMLNGWIPAKKFDALEKKIEKNFPATALIKAEPKEGEEPPMQIRNIDALAPFEAVTRLYGLPQGSEMDPTRPLMPFFILYFGLCLTDAGYGFVIATLMGLAILKFKLKRQDQKLIWLLFYAGIVTFFVSIPFGGWFGMTPDQAPLWATYTNSAGDLRFMGQIWDLTKDVDFFRNLALSLGAIQILFGLFLAGYWKAIHGKVFDAISANFSVHLFVIALALKYGLSIPGMDYALIAISALFVWGQGSGKWFIRPLIGALGAVNFCIGLMSNILSYLRILALGLATGALAFAINQIGLVIYDLLPIFLGIPVFIAILLFGHMTSIALNALGSFVHSGRLQFIEFFGQFFQGGGREFVPFKRTVTSVT